MIEIGVRGMGVREVRLRGGMLRANAGSKRQFHAGHVKSLPPSAGTNVSSAAAFIFQRLRRDTRRRWYARHLPLRARQAATGSEDSGPYRSLEVREMRHLFRDSEVSGADCTVAAVLINFRPSIPRSTTSPIERREPIACARD